MPQNKVSRALRTHSSLTRQDASETVPVHTVQVVDMAMFINKRVFKSYFW